MCFFQGTLLDLSGDDEDRLDELVTEVCKIVQTSVTHGGLVEVAQAGVHARNHRRMVNPD